MKINSKNNKIILITVSLLIISIIINIFNIITKSKYEERIGIITYDNVINIKVTSISNSEILSKATSSGSIEISDLLKLYKNYIIISNNIISLWDEYTYYQNNKYIWNKKTITTDASVVNDIHNRIEDYLNELIQENTKKKSVKMDLGGKDLQNFIEMQGISFDIVNFYNDFIKEKMDGMNTEERKKEVIDNYYWIDILDNIDLIGKDYSDFNVM